METARGRYAVALTRLKRGQDARRALEETDISRLNYYELLNVAADASHEEILLAQMQLSRLLGKGAGEAGENLKVVLADACSWLADEQERVMYDRDLEYRANRSPGYKDPWRCKGPLWGTAVKFAIADTHDDHGMCKSYAILEAMDEGIFYLKVNALIASVLPTGRLSVRQQTYIIYNPWERIGNIFLALESYHSCNTAFLIVVHPFLRSGEELEGVHFVRTNYWRQLPYEAARWEEMGKSMSREDWLRVKDSPAAMTLAAMEDPNHSYHSPTFDYLCKAMEKYPHHSQVHGFAVRPMAFVVVTCVVRFLLIALLCLCIYLFGGSVSIWFFFLAFLPQLNYNIMGLICVGLLYFASNSRVALILLLSVVLALEFIFVSKLLFTSRSHDYYGDHFPVAIRPLGPCSVEEEEHGEEESDEEEDLNGKDDQERAEKDQQVPVGQARLQTLEQKEKERVRQKEEKEGLRLRLQAEMEREKEILRQAEIKREKERKKERKRNEKEKEARRRQLQEEERVRVARLRELKELERKKRELEARALAVKADRERMEAERKEREQAEEEERERDAAVEAEIERIKAERRVQRKAEREKRRDERVRMEAEEAARRSEAILVQAEQKKHRAAERQAAERAAFELSLEKSRAGNDNNRHDVNADELDVTKGGLSLNDDDDLDRLRETLGNLKLMQFWDAMIDDLGVSSFSDFSRLSQEQLESIAGIKLFHVRRLMNVQE